MSHAVLLLSQPASTAPPRGRWVLVIVLACWLFGLGLWSEQVLLWLTTAWQHLAAAVGLRSWSQQLQAGVSGHVTTRSLPAVLSYGLLYTGSCWLLLTTAAWNWTRAQRIAQGYGLGFLACGVLLLVGKAMGNNILINQLGRQLIEFIVSPLPVMCCLPFLSLNRNQKAA